MTSDRSCPYNDLQQNVNRSFDELMVDEFVYVPNREAEEIFNISHPEKVQIFFIDPDGTVSTFPEQSSLSIFQFKEKQANEKTTIFIQVSGWTHPLSKESPVFYNSEDGSFMFPDAYSKQASETLKIDSFLKLFSLQDIWYFLNSLNLKLTGEIF